MDTSVIVIAIVIYNTDKLSKKDETVLYYDARVYLMYFLLSSKGYWTTVYNSATGRNNKDLTITLGNLNPKQKNTVSSTKFFSLFLSIFGNKIRRAFLRSTLIGYSLSRFVESR